VNKMNQPRPVPGMLVYSTAGRDYGNPYLIVEVLEEPYVLVADGEVRRLKNPKRKNIRHLNLTGLTEEDISVKLIEGAFSSDTELRKALSELVTGQNLEQRG